MPTAYVKAKTSRQAIGMASVELGMARGRYKVESVKYRRTSKDWKVTLNRK